MRAARRGTVDVGERAAVSQVRRLGARTAASVGAVGSALVLVAVGFGWLVSTETAPIFDLDVRSYFAAALLAGGFVAVVVIGGAIAGWFWGPKTVVPGSRPSSVLLVLEVAATAVLVGCLGISSLLVLVDVAGLLFSQGLAGLDEIVTLPLRVLLYSVFGLVLLGWIALIATIPMACLWLWLMRQPSEDVPDSDPRAEADR